MTYNHLHLLLFYGGGGGIRPRSGHLLPARGPRVDHDL